jgi:hypothetical protein
MTKTNYELTIGGKLRKVYKNSNGFFVKMNSKNLDVNNYFLKNGAGLKSKYINKNKIYGGTMVDNDHLFFVYEIILSILISKDNKDKDKENYHKSNVKLLEYKNDIDTELKELQKEIPEIPKMNKLIQNYLSLREYQNNFVDLKNHLDYNNLFKLKDKFSDINGGDFSIKMNNKNVNEVFLKNGGKSKNKYRNKRTGGINNPVTDLNTFISKMLDNNNSNYLPEIIKLIKLIKPTKTDSKLYYNNLQIYLNLQRDIQTFLKNCNTNIFDEIKLYINIYFSPTTSAITPSIPSAITASTSTPSTPAESVKPSTTSAITPSTTSAITPSIPSAITASTSTPSTPAESVKPSTTSAITPSTTSAITASTSEKIIEVECKYSIDFGHAFVITTNMIILLYNLEQEFKKLELEFKKYQAPFIVIWNKQKKILEKIIHNLNEAYEITNIKIVTSKELRIRINKLVENESRFSYKKEIIKPITINTVKRSLEKELKDAEPDPETELSELLEKELEEAEPEPEPEPGTELRERIIGNDTNTNTNTNFSKIISIIRKQIDFFNSPDNTVYNNSKDNAYHYDIIIRKLAKLAELAELAKSAKSTELAELAKSAKSTELAKLLKIIENLRKYKLENLINLINLINSMIKLSSDINEIMKKNKTFFNDEKHKELIDDLFNVINNETIITDS